VANPKLASLSDPFTAASINTTLWNNITAGTATLDTVNDLVVLAQPTVANASNTFGSTALYDATSSSIYAEVGPVANGNGHTNTAFKLLLDANNSVAMRLQSGTFNFTLQTAGTTVTTQLAASFDPNAYGWWRIREASGVFYADVSADGYNWTNLYSSAYTWSATGVQFQFITTASATEVSGNVATIQHVNTMLGGPFNINWPRLEDGWGAQWECNGGDLPLDRYVDLTTRTQGQSTAQRGKQYEMDQIQSGTAGASLKNTDGALDPLNSAGAYYGHITPYQPWRRRMMWPPSRNFLSQVHATGGDLGGQPLGTINSGEGGPDIFSTTDPTGGSFVASTTAWSGGVVMQFAVPTTITPGWFIAWIPQPAVNATPTPGTTTPPQYSQSVQVRNITPSTTVQVEAVLQWRDINQTIISQAISTPVTLTGSATAGWTQLTVSGTPPVNAAMMYVAVGAPTAPAAAVNVQVDGWQAEVAAASSSWSCPGVWLGMFGGFTENWESSWDMGGTYGVVTPTGVDAMGLLSQVTLADPLTQQIMQNSPRFLYPLGDPSGSQSASDQTGNYPQIPITNGKYGAGSLVFGTSITAANLVTGTYTGSSGTVATLANPDPGTTYVVGASYLSLSAAGITGPANPALWTRMIAFRYTGPLPTYRAYLWSAFDSQRSNGYPSGSQLSIFLDSSGKPNFTLQGPTGANTTAAFFGATNCADSNWHLLVLGYDQATGVIIASQDGNASAVYTGISASNTPTGLISDNLGGWVDVTIGNGTTYNYAGDLSFCAEWPSFDPSLSVATALYQGWKSAFAGDSTNRRYQRILGWAGYTGLSSLQSGVTTDMGPATDITGLDALSALQTVVDTENGQHFVDRFGSVQFQARSARYNATTPVYTFGENTSAGEWPYENVVMPLDPTHVANLVQVTQYDSNQVFQAQDATSQNDYFPRTLQRTINAALTTECQAAAQYLLSRYKQPAVRISSIVLHPSANPAMWPVCLSLELGMRITVNRRPPAAPMISVPCFIENINWAWDDTGEATVTLQCSPVDLTPYGIFASWHSTLHVAPSAGATSITVNASVDNTNPLAAQLGGGQLLVLGVGTAAQETVQVKTVAATTSGWSTCVIQLVAATVNNHSVGDMVCEPLPTGITDPTTWNSSAMFDSNCFSY
jgi:hypothetical protein